MSRTKKAHKADTDNQQQSVDEMFPPIGDTAAPAPEDDGAEFMPGFKTREDAVKAFDELKTANQRYTTDLAATQKSVETMQSMLDQLMAGQQARGAQAEPEADTIDLSKLPDPVEDKDGFTKGVMDAVGKLVQAQTARTAQGLTKQQQMDRLWGKFKEKHSELAGFDEIVESAAREVLTEAHARGVDPERLMLQQTERFFSKVADTANARISKLKEKFGVREDDGDDDSDIRDSAPAGRDRGLSDSSRGRPITDREGSEKLGSLIGDLKKLQRSSGFF